MIEDFKTLPKNGKRFESLVRHLLDAMGYRILKKESDGQDGGRDILIERVLQDAMGKHSEKVVIQCKHKAHGGKAVGDRAVGVFQNVIDRNKAQGYLLVTSTTVTENLKNAFTEYSKQYYPRWADFWNVNDIIRFLNKYPDVQKTFFPLSSPHTPLELLANEIKIWLDAIGYNTDIQRGDNQLIDLKANLQRGLEVQNIFVRCVADEITVRHLEELKQEIGENKNLNCWVISDRRVPPSVNGYANRYQNINPLSLTDFVAKIFGPYINRLQNLVAEDGLARYYVDLSCHRRVIDNEGNEIGCDRYDIIDEYVDDWIKARGTNHLSILGDIGSGKTWFSRHYADRQLTRYLNNPAIERFPIHISLRNYSKEVNVDSLILQLLDEQGLPLNSGQKAFDRLNRLGKFLYIFDGFDEMSVKTDYQALVDNFWELAKIVGPGSKVLLTCRTGYFRYAHEAEKVLQGEEQGRKVIILRPPKFDVIYLEPFNSDQIREVVTRRCGFEYCESFMRNSDLVELAQQPVLSDILMKGLPDIYQSSIIKKTDVYRFSIDRWLERDVRTGRTFLTKKDKYFFMMELAWEMLITKKFKFHYKELPEQINHHFGLRQQDEKDHYDYDIRSNSFLRRDSKGNYEFSHRSIVDYLSAVKVVDCIKDGQFDVLRPIEIHNQEVWQFIEDLIPIVEIDLNKITEAIISTPHVLIHRALIAVAMVIVHQKFPSNPLEAKLASALIKSMLFVKYHALTREYIRNGYLVGRPLHELIKEVLSNLTPAVLPQLENAAKICEKRGEQGRAGAWQAKKALEQAIKTIVAQHERNKHVGHNWD